MRSLSSLFLLTAVLVASAPIPDAQVGRLLNRAREAVSDVRDGAEGTAPNPSRTGPAPALDFGSLLDTYILAERSEIRLGDPKDYFLLFPNAGLDPSDVGGRYQLLDATGDVIWSANLRYARETGTPAIVRLKGTGATAPIPASGAYTLEVVYGGGIVGALPFTATRQDSGDPFAPGTATRVEGPWRTHAYFEHEIEEPDGSLTFNAWLHRDEPQGQRTTEVSIRRDGREVAWGAGSADGSSDGWARAEYWLYTPEARADEFGQHTATAPNWTVQDVTPGPYEIVLSTPDGVFRTMTVEGGDGAFVPHPRSAVDVEPRSHYLTPRRIAGQLLRRAHRLDWVGPESL
ncbi:hypothetical protein [Rubrivirga sp. IMCC43871]|uniref:hypothetical protein n=1 Tax=Rubrivirga sp. IMCC43871 TaxID=3391575 RepID=UPI00398F8E6C